MFLAWTVLVQVKNKRTRAMLAADLLCRTLKRLIGEQTSERLEKLKAQHSSGTSSAAGNA